MMKTWTLVWMLIFPADDAGMYGFEYHKQADLTYSRCVELLAKKDQQFKDDVVDGKIAGHQIFCREE